MERNIQMLRLGKLPARPFPKKFSLAALVDTANLPPLPNAFGHETLIGPDAWGMLANDKVGCCVLSGGAHETMLLNMEANKVVPFDAAATLSDYTAITGYNPTDPATDQGTDVQDAATYRTTTGLRDANGTRHKIVTSLGLEPGNLTSLWQGLYLFGAVGIGVQLPSSALDQFNNNQPWDVVTGSTIVGGHYVSLVAKRGMLYIVTWGKLQLMTVNFLTTYCDEARVYLSQEDLINQKSPEGFDYAQLQTDLAALT
jgi:hypothetical protein